jgi:predicted enzyme related to lactoylglutathione lyase
MADSPANRVIHFEIHAADPERAVRFYTELFGWQTQKWGGPMDYWLVTTGPDGQPGINGGIMRRQGPAPVEGQAVCSFINTIQTPDLDKSVQKVAFLGGKICLPKMPVPGIGWLAYATDLDGNIFGMMQSDPAAA